MSAIPTPARRGEVMALLSRVSVLLGSIGDEGTRPTHEALAVAHFDRIRRLFAGAKVLLTANLTHEVIVLNRPLFTESLALAEVASADDVKRVELVVGWQLAGLSSLERIVRKTAPSERRPSLLEGLRQQRAEVEGYARRLGARRTKNWRPDAQAEALAVKHGRGDELIVLLVAHEFVHGSTSAVSQRYAVGLGTMEIGGPAIEQDAWFVDTARSAANSALHAVRAVCTILDRSEPEDVSELLSEVERLGAVTEP